MPKPTTPDSEPQTHCDDVLDEALDESFPASDPPSPTRRHRNPSSAPVCEPDDDKKAG